MIRFVDLEVIDKFCIESTYNKCFNTSYILEVNKEDNNKSSIKLSYSSIIYFINMSYDSLIKLLNKKINNINNYE